jgi:hypothetical protein
MRDRDGPNIFGSTLSTSGNDATINFGFPKQITDNCFIQNYLNS